MLHHRNRALQACDEGMEHALPSQIIKIACKNYIA